MKKTAHRKVYILLHILPFVLLFINMFSTLELSCDPQITNRFPLYFSIDLDNAFINTTAILENFDVLQISNIFQNIIYEIVHIEGYEIGIYQYFGFSFVAYALYVDLLYMLYHVLTFIWHFISSKFERWCDR